MDLGLRGKVALVSAASRGLGRAIADAIAKRSGVEVEMVVADVSSEEGIARLWQRARDHFGHVDVLVTNAGGPPSGPLESLEWESWQRAVEVTLRSAVELTRLVLPGM